MSNTEKKLKRMRTWLFRLFGALCGLVSGLMFTSIDLTAGNFIVYIAANILAFVVFSRTVTAAFGRDDYKE